MNTAFVLKTNGLYQPRSSELLARRREMVVKKFASVAVTLVALMVLAGAAQGQQIHIGQAQAGNPPVGTEEPCILNPCLLYAGDFDANGQNPTGLFNGVNTSFNLTGTVYIPLTIPVKFKGAKGKTDWQVSGLFVNELMEDVGSGTEVNSASWSIVTGVAEGGNPNGNQVKTVCSGTGVPTVTPTGRSLFSFIPEVTILITGINCPPILESGSYWFTLVPTSPALLFVSDVEDNSPANIQGPGTEPDDLSFFVSNDFGFPNFTNATTVCGGFGCDRFSAGVVAVATH
jgi:hypothetical protein